MDALRGKVAQGTCGWSDTSIVKCGRFYPPFVKTCEDKLQHYSQYFPCAECDSSNYAIPSPFKIERWLKCVPKKFLFHFKAYGLFTRQYAPWNSVPSLARNKFADSFQQSSSSGNVTYNSLPTSMRDYIWELFNTALEPAFKQSKLGVVVFQFPLNFQPSNESREHIEHCRKKLSAPYRMVVEFRNRTWLCLENLSKTLDWLKGLEIGLVVADELKDELYMGRPPSSLPRLEDDVSTANPRVTPIVMALADPACCYIRIHRREGNHRVLSSSEIESWVSRLTNANIQKELKGPIYFMWGTDHEDQPIINSKNLSAAIGDFGVHWKPENKNNTLLSFCTKSPKAKGIKRDSNNCIELPMNQETGKTEEKTTEEVVPIKSESEPLHESSPVHGHLAMLEDNANAKESKEGIDIDVNDNQILKPFYEKGSPILSRKRLYERDDLSEVKSGKKLRTDISPKLKSKGGEQGKRLTSPSKKDPNQRTIMNFFKKQ